MAKHAAPVPFLDLRLDAANPRPLYRQLYEALRACLLAGHLAPGGRLPPTRTMALQLGVSRFTVVAAFEQLLAEGYLCGRPGSGTFVSRELPGRPSPLPVGAMQAGAGPPRLSRRGLLLASTSVTVVPEEAPPVAPALRQDERAPVGRRGGEHAAAAR